MIRVGVIGYGYWGPNLVRNFMDVPGSTVAAIADLRPERRACARARYPAVQITADAGEILASPAIDAVVIATPVASHYDLALRALKAGRHVFVEKPMTATADEACRLIDEAARGRRVLMVDHTFVYTGAVRVIRDMIGNHAIGELYYYESVRTNPARLQADVSVLWDLAVHDLSIMDVVLPAGPCAVSATGVSFRTGQPEDAAYMTMFFDSRLVAHVHVNCQAPSKVRRTVIGGDKMLIYDDREPNDKVRICDSGVSTGWAPPLDTTEALRTEALHFTACIEAGTPPETDGHSGLRVVRILEAAERSLKRRGHPMDVRRT